MNETLYHEAEQVGGYNALALRAMALWAHEHKADKEAMRIASFVWQRNARIMAKAVERFPKDFETDGHGADDYLSLFAMAQLSRADAAILAKERIDKTLAAWQVRERVDTLKKRTTRQRAKPKDDTLAEQIATIIADVYSVDVDQYEARADANGKGIDQIAALPEIASALAARNGGEVKQNG